MQVLQADTSDWIKVYKKRNCKIDVSVCARMLSLLSPHMVYMHGDQNLSVPMLKEDAFSGEMIPSSQETWMVRFFI